jgi:hypothetical protein
MERTVNRWLTVVLLFCFLAIIAFAAGRQNATAATSVLVTNSTSQPVPIKQTATLNINDSTHGKDGLQIFRNFPTSVNVEDGIGTVNAIPGERFVITNIEVNYESPDNDVLTAARVSTSVGNGPVLGLAGIPITVQSVGPSSFSIGHWQGTIFLDPGQTLSLHAFRSGSVSGTVYFMLTGYRVTYP